MKNYNSAYHEKQIYNSKFPIRIIFHKDNPKMIVTPHWHYGIELLYVEKGEPGICYILGKEYKLKENHLLIIGPSTIHRLELCITDSDKLLTLIIPPEWLFYIHDTEQFLLTVDPISINLDLDFTDSNLIILRNKFHELINISSNNNISWKQK
ncbi:cupin domain-containing protein, partial [Bombilactobacillus bombi]|uniref:cupin domain-containing protein n=1 Tax=Bombilactobacillus bombi TaxID=1303590 RepID=UPI0015E5D7DE